MSNDTSSVLFSINFQNRLEHSMIGVGTVAVCFCAWGFFILVMFYGRSIKRTLLCTSFRAREGREERNRDYEKDNVSLPPPSYEEIRKRDELPRYEEIIITINTRELTRNTQV